MNENSASQGQLPSPADGAREFLLHEYQSLYTLHQGAKDVGETRLNFYVTFAAAIGSILIASQQFIQPDMYRWMLLGGSVITMCLGLITFRKMLQRRTTIIIYRRRLGRIRRWFVQHYPEIIPGLPYEIDRDPAMHWGVNRLGSTAFSVAFINTALTTVLLFALFVDIFNITALWWSIPLSLIVGFLTWWGHVLWTNRWMQAADAEDRQNLIRLDLSSGLRTLSSLPAANTTSREATINPIPPQYKS